MNFDVLFVILYSISAFPRIDVFVFIVESCSGVNNWSQTPCLRSQ